MRQLDGSAWHMRHVASVVAIASVVAAGAVVLVQSHDGPAGSHARVLGERLIATGTSTSGNNGCGNGGGGGTKTSCASAPGKSFLLSGVLDADLTPGAQRSLIVTITNPNNQDLQVTKLVPTVQSPTGGAGRSDIPSCTKNWIVIGAGYSYVAGQEKLIAYADPSKPPLTLSIPIKMSDLDDTNQDNCKNASFPIKLSATGQQA